MQPWIQSIVILPVPLVLVLKMKNALNATLDSKHCHPACATCFGPENEECFECNPGFLQIDNNTCDTECAPENSYVIEEICYRKFNLSIFLI